MEVSAVTPLGLPLEKEYIVTLPNEVEDIIQEILFKQQCESVLVKTYLWDEYSKKWYIEKEQTHYAPNTPRDFLLLKEGAHERRFTHTFMQECIIHRQSKLWFCIDATENARYSDDLLNNPEVLFYKFKYTTPSGKVYRFIAMCDMRHSGYSAEQLERVRTEILRPGAMWFCEHIREKYRSYFDEDAYTQILKARKD